MPPVVESFVAHFGEMGRRWDIKLLAASQGVAWIEICSTNGTKFVALDLGTKKIPDAPMAIESHCGYCLLQQHSPVVPTPPYTLEVAAVSFDHLPFCSGVSIFKRFARCAHYTRAPPALPTSA
ncbi:MAG: DUF2946 family protein [Gammaproteobacteria bacterium]|nr:DUF2946 family protein [Gammaproteobacteria bacterium]